MQRFILVITDEGLDAVMPISNDPNAPTIKNKAKIMMTFEYEQDPNKMRTDELNKTMSKIMSEHPELKGGGADPQSYVMFNIRAQYAGSGSKKYYIGLDKEDMKKIQRSGSKEGAFHILDILVTGKTKLGRFGDGKEETIIGSNLNKDWDEDDKKRAKARRRKFYDEITYDDDDEDEI